MKRPTLDIKTVEALLARLNPADLERISQSMLDEIDVLVRNRWDAAVKRAAELPGDVRPEKIEALRRKAVRELTAAGAAAGAASASPIVGSVATMLATTAELLWFTSRAGDLILTLAALHGHAEPTVDERRAWVLAVLIYGPAARDGLSNALADAGMGVAVPAASRIPAVTLQSANRLLARHLLRRYGTRRGIVALGRALPLGLGAVIGGGANYRAVTQLVDSASRFFSQMPYSAVDTTGTPIAGRLG